MSMNPENKCNDIAPKTINKLSNEDSLKIMYEMQASLQERLGKLQEYRHMDMHDRCREAIYNMQCVSGEFVELIDRLPWKAWKNYDISQLDGWTDFEQFNETLMEYVDMFHFFMNIGIIFGFTADQIFAFYKEKNKENFARQEKGGKYNP